MSEERARATNYDLADNVVLLFLFREFRKVSVVLGLAPMFIGGLSVRAVWYGFFDTPRQIFRARKVPDLAATAA